MVMMIMALTSPWPLDGYRRYWQTTQIYFWTPASEEYGSRLCRKRTFAEMNASAYACSPCGKTFTGPEPYNQHIASEKHKKKIQSGPVPSSSLVCEPCQMSFTGPAPMRDHMASAGHTKAMAQHQALTGQALLTFGSGDDVH
ncbi:hypothetical protein HPB49_025151 [Dermacentor silvarum]|uniref:Uncharacterized protein n=1 Tax=Dermacentor silvarum TaxID=543639 RepID=A0ACB8DKW3_DERSI|nr:hypothetical protein HPB49_025151 [Dermacentor silvarum]